MAQNYGAGKQERIREGQEVGAARTGILSGDLSVSFCVCKQLLLILSSHTKQKFWQLEFNTCGLKVCFILESDSVFVLWILPGSQKTGNVGCADGDFFGDTGSTGICIVSGSSDRGVRNLECSSDRMDSGRYCRMDLL